MAVFSASKRGLAPLQLQLRPISTGTARVREIIANGESTLGSADWPQLSIPSVLGTVAQAVTPQGNPGSVSGFQLAWAWSVSPSLPSSGGSVSILPVSYNLQFPQNAEPLVRAGSSLLLYANSLGGHTYNGTMIWEEAS